jgi:rifampin ADP-ribosylating transferase
MSYRSLHPFKVVGEVSIWQGHSVEQVKAMKDGLVKLKEQGIESLDILHNSTLPAKCCTNLLLI